MVNFSNQAEKRKREVIVYPTNYYGLQWGTVLLPQ